MTKLIYICGVMATQVAVTYILKRFCLVLCKEIANFKTSEDEHYKRSLSVYAIHAIYRLSVGRLYVYFGLGVWR